MGRLTIIGYPMSIPSRIDRGEEIVFSRWGPVTNTGRIRLNLARPIRRRWACRFIRAICSSIPASRSSAVIGVVADKPHVWTWLFQGRREDNLSVDGLVGTMGKDPALRITPMTNELALAAKVEPTVVVYSYSSKFGTFNHISYETTKPTESAQVDFVLTWK